MMRVHGVLPYLVRETGLIMLKMAKKKTFNY